MTHPKSIARQAASNPELIVHLGGPIASCNNTDKTHNPLEGLTHSAGNRFRPAAMWVGHHTHGLCAIYRLSLSDVDNADVFAIWIILLMSSRS
jgi:hypothetical protein